MVGLWLDQNCWGSDPVRWFIAVKMMTFVNETVKLGDLQQDNREFSFGNDLIRRLKKELMMSII